MAGETNFDFENIPIPVDYRVREFTKRLGIKVIDDEDVRKFWNSVLEEIKKSVEINMIHLDSLIWQIGVLSREEIVEYFARLGLRDLGERIVEVLAK
jgi:DNA-(apurinic or apyrimidinic site) lyase